MPVNCSCSPRLAELKEATGSVWVLLTKTDLSTVPLNLQPGPAWCEPRSGMQSGKAFLQQMWQRSEGLQEEQELPLQTATGEVHQQNCSLQAATVPRALQCWQKKRELLQGKSMRPHFHLTCSPSISVKFWI